MAITNEEIFEKLLSIEKRIFSLEQKVASLNYEKSEEDPVPVKETKSKQTKKQKPKPPTGPKKKFSLKDALGFV